MKFHDLVEFKRWFIYQQTSILAPQYFANNSPLQPQPGNPELPTPVTY